MKVLFVIDGYYPTTHAAGYCVHQIVEFLKKHDVHCDIINIIASPVKRDTFYYEESTIYNILDEYNADLSDIKKIPTAELLWIVICKISERINPYIIKNRKCRKIEIILKKIGHQYDAIIPVVADFNNGCAVMNYCRTNPVPFILYQVDPIGTNYTQVKYKQRLNEFENKLYAGASFILTTPIIKKEKETDNQFDDRKIIPVEFPNIVNLSVERQSDSKKIICSFCGSIYAGIRDCRYILDLFSIIKDTDILIQFAGVGQEDVVRSYSEGVLKAQITHKGNLPKEGCISFMQESDFLINLGNRMTNQVPSKLFDYISTGLPIINVCKNSDCPTLSYLEKYDFALNLVETEIKTEKNKQAEKLYRFILENCGKRKSYDYIQMLFRENTPDYVGEQFLKALKQI